MHIPDAYLSPLTQAVAFVVMAPIWTMAVRRTNRDLSTKQIPLLSIGSAFCFAIQMFNIPAIGGTSAHALGASLLAILVGPWAAILGMTLTLAIQSLLFGDGGILSLGANCFNMAFVAVVVSYGTYSALRRCFPSKSTGDIVSAGIGAYLGTVTAALSAGVILGLQPLIAHDNMGQCLYCPFGMNVTVPAMVITHLLVAGPAEAIITIGALAYLWRAFPEYIHDSKKLRVESKFRLVLNFACLLILTPIGLIASGSAFGEWDLEELRRMVGFVPSGMAHSKPLVHPLMPDYGFAGLQGRPWEVAGYLASAAVGVIVIATFARMLLIRRRIALAPQSTIIVPVPPKKNLPTWLARPNPMISTPGEIKAASTNRVKNGPWLDRTVKSMRAATQRTIGAEVIAHSPGLLQSVSPMTKVFGALAALIVVSTTHHLAILGLILASVACLAGRSAIPAGPFWRRIVGSTLFFGLVAAVPIAFTVSAPPETATLFGVHFSQTRVEAALLLLARLAAGISIAFLWQLTTKWHQILGSMQAVGLPSLVIAATSMTYRYLFTMMETLAEMLEARSARQVIALSKREAREYAGTGTAILFSKSLAFSEEMHLAMQARGAFLSGSRSGPPSAKFDLRPRLALGGIAMIALVLLQGVFHAI